MSPDFPGGKRDQHFFFFRSPHLFLLGDFEIAFLFCSLWQNELEGRGKRTEKWGKGKVFFFFSFFAWSPEQGKLGEPASLQDEVWENVLGWFLCTLTFLRSILIVPDLMPLRHLFWFGAGLKSLVEISQCWQDRFQVTLPSEIWKNEMMSPRCKSDDFCYFFFIHMSTSKHLMSQIFFPRIFSCSWRCFVDDPKPQIWGHQNHDLVVVRQMIFSPNSQISVILQGMKSRCWQFWLFWREKWWQVDGRGMQSRC